MPSLIRLQLAPMQDSVLTFAIAVTYFNSEPRLNLVIPAKERHPRESSICEFPEHPQTDGLDARLCGHEVA